MSQLPSQKRYIFGARVNREFFDLESNNFNTRVDIREKWFTLEFFIKNEFSLNYFQLKNLLGKIPDVSIEVYLRDSFLRDAKKLSILISIEEHTSVHQTTISTKKIVIHLISSSLNSMHKDKTLL